MRTLAYLVLLSSLILWLGACEESVDVVLGTERAFTVYGHLSPRADTQAVRVFAIDGTIDRVRSLPLEADVRSVDLQTGDIHVWRDSVIQFAPDNFGHVFWAPFRPDFGDLHTLLLTRSDGTEARVDIEVPPLSEPELMSPVLESDYVLLPILWKRAPRLNNIRVVYHTNMGSYDFTYPNQQIDRLDGQVAVVQMHIDARFVFSEIFRQGGSARDTRLRAVEQRVLVSSADWWPPGNTFDPDLLVEPGIFSNVKNGFGFVGSGYEASFHYDIPDSIALAAGFFVDSATR